MNQDEDDLLETSGMADLLRSVEQCERIENDPELIKKDHNINKKTLEENIMANKPTKNTPTKTSVKKTTEKIPSATEKKTADARRKLNVQKGAMNRNIASKKGAMTMIKRKYDHGRVKMFSISDREHVEKLENEIKETTIERDKIVASIAKLK